MAAAALINAVGALMEELVETSSGTKQEIAANMGVTPARVSQLLTGDGNVRIASLARLADACGWDVAFTATDRATGRQIVAPRRRARGVRPETGSALAASAARPEATEAIRAGREGLALVPELRQHG